MRWRSASGRLCWPWEGIAPHMSQGRRWVLGFASCPAPALSAEPCAFCCLYFLATFLSWKEEIAGALQAEARGSALIPQLIPLSLPSPLRAPPGPAAEGEQRSGARGPVWQNPEIFRPHAQRGKFFLLYLVCFNLKGKRRHLHPLPPARLRSHPAVELPHTRGLVLRPPFSLWRELMGGHYGGPLANLVWVGGKNSHGLFRECIWNERRSCAPQKALFAEE